MEAYLRGSLVSGRMGEAIGLWMRMYTGRAPWIDEEVRGINLAAFVAAEVARLATVEMESRVSGEGGRAAVLNAAYQPVIDGARVFTEYAAAGGSVALKPYIEPGSGRLAVDVVRAGDFFPTAFDGQGNVTGCLFVERREQNGKAYVRVEEHSVEAGGVVCVRNRAYRLEGAQAGCGWPEPLDVVDAWASLSAEVRFEGLGGRPLFAILQMPGANVVEPGCPMGVSAFARATELIREAEVQFARLIWEMESGKRALYVDMRAFEGEEAEPGRLPFTRFYRTMDADPMGGETLFREWSPALREREQVAALDQILQRVEDVCGLSRGTLSEAPESASRGARTATELKIMRQRTYATVRDVQKAVEKALRQLLWAMDVWCTVAGLAEDGTWDVSFAFDDSVVTDRGEAFAERVKLVEMGVMEKWELRKWYLGESAAQALSMKNPHDFPSEVGTGDSA